MGQKTNPTGNRLGFIKGWDSNWYGGKDYSAKLVEDEKIRKYLYARLQKASISKIIIERTLKLITITINTARPGVIIGKAGSEVDKLKEELKKLTSKEVQKEDVKETLIEEYSKYDKDLRLLTYKILLEKFNKNYKNLLPEQKNILKEFITSVNSTTKLKKVVNEEIKKIKEKVEKFSNNIKDEVVKIKLHEVTKNLVPVKKTEKITDNHLVNLMQYYDLVKEMQRL